MNETELQVHGVNLDMMTNQPVVILKDLESKKFLPIWIGQFEATSILMEIQGVEAARPLTHDLLRSVIDELGADVVKIVIDDIEDGTFFAKIHLRLPNSVRPVDARPSDAIALAVRTRSPIFATDKVVAKAAMATEFGEEDEVEKFKEFLEGIEPEDFQE